MNALEECYHCGQKFPRGKMHRITIWFGRAYHSPYRGCWDYVWECEECHRKKLELINRGR